MIHKQLLLKIVALLFFLGCTDPYSFDIKNSDDRLVIESFISDVSYFESLDYPSDGRCFITKLRYGQNLYGKGENISGALVVLESNNGNEWLYTETEAGNYVLTDSVFKAIQGIEYKLKVTLPNNEYFESEWESLVSTTHVMGDVSFIERTKFENVYENGKNEVKEVLGINLTIDIPENTVGNNRFYLWQYDATWIYLAGRKTPGDANYKCWVKGNSYLSNYTIGEDNSGGYTKELTFIDVETNERVFYDISFLIKEYIVNEDYYNFLDELNRQQTESSSFFASPPYNLKSNYHARNSESNVFGYFSVRNERAKRMYFNTSYLSYGIDPNSAINACKSIIPPYGPDDPCDNCLFYNAGGESSLLEPDWWHQ